MDDTRAFQLEEYKALRKEVEIYIAEVRSQERYVAVGISAIWYFLIHEHKSNWLLWLIPTLICVASAFRLYGIERHFRTVSHYVQSLERNFGVKGWEQREPFWGLGTINTILLSLLSVLTVVAFFLRYTLSS